MQVIQWTGRPDGTNESSKWTTLGFRFTLSFGHDLLSLFTSMSSVALRRQGASTYARGISHSWRPQRSASSFPSLPGSLDASRHYTGSSNGSRTSR